MWLPPGESSAIMWPITSAFQLWKNYYSVLKILPVECSTTYSTLPLVWRFPFVWAGDTGECGFWWSEVTAKFEHIPSCPESRSSNHLGHLQPKQSIWRKSMDENILTKDRLLNTNLCWIPNGKKIRGFTPKKIETTNNPIVRYQADNQPSVASQVAVTRWLLASTYSSSGLRICPNNPAPL